MHEYIQMRFNFKGFLLHFLLHCMHTHEPNYFGYFLHNINRLKANYTLCIVTG